MRWLKHCFTNGDKRVRRVFLFFPKSDFYPSTRVKETRWLEWAWIQEQYIEGNYARDDRWWFLKFLPQQVKAFQYGKKSIRQLEAEIEKGFESENV
jgi:hypothetical protein